MWNWKDKMDWYEDSDRQASSRVQGQEELETRYWQREGIKGAWQHQFGWEKIICQGGPKNGQGKARVSGVHKFAYVNTFAICCHITTFKKGESLFSDSRHIYRHLLYPPLANVSKVRNILLHSHLHLYPGSRVREGIPYHFSCFFIKLIKGGGGHSRL